MTLAVVVPAYNAAHVAPKTVPAMLAQRAPARWTFVDDGSADGTGDVLRQLIADAELAPGVEAQVLRLEPNAGRAAARNAGIAASGRADIVVMLDVDAAPAPGFLDAHREAHAAGAVAAVARLHYAETDLSEPYGRYLNSALRGPRPGRPADPVPWRYFVTTACSVRREAFQKAGGFDLSVTYGEDLDLAGRLAARHPDGLRLAGRADVYDHRDLAGTLGVIGEFGARNLPHMARANPDLLGLAGLGALASPKWRHRLARAVLPPVAGLARRALPALPAALVPPAVRLVLAGHLTRSFRDGARRTDLPA